MKSRCRNSNRADRDAVASERGAQPGCQIRERTCGDRRDQRWPRIDRACDALDSALDSTGASRLESRQHAADGRVDRRTRDAPPRDTLGDPVCDRSA